MKGCNVNRGSVISVVDLSCEGNFNLAKPQW